jgi:hypothetical protein
LSSFGIWGIHSPKPANQTANRKAKKQVALLLLLWVFGVNWIPVFVFRVVYILLSTSKLQNSKEWKWTMNLMKKIMLRMSRRSGYAGIVLVALVSSYWIAVLLDMMYQWS